uniref:Small ribosomal subunit protein uS14c n=1 Tax=Bulboplastis apyrenoidosa TaxID=1070855 RepID=A0A1Y9TM49_9RHOD|nr:30S ribosomal protein S14 [Bulboplastis apyrenoidosa]ARO90756.1 30S ribosomal protein S14 [Bulboplastis apyrenoidosa]
MIAREKKRASLCAKFNNKRKSLRHQLVQANTIEEKLTIQEELQALPKNSAPSRKRNRCWLTGRSRGYYRDFGLSRHVLREMTHECLLPGVVKSSW